MGNKPSIGKRLQSINKERKKKEKFIRTRMWISTIISTFFTDTGAIPKNIGNNILILNNMYITKNYLNAYIMVRELSEYTPVGWTSDLIEVVKSRVPGATIDIVMRGNKYNPDTRSSGIGSRERSWNLILDNPLMPEESVRRAARCKYSLEVLRSNSSAYKVRTYIIVRAKDNRVFKQAITATKEYLHGIGATYQKIDRGLEEHLQYSAFMSLKKPDHLRDFAYQIHTAQTLTESLPAIQGMHNHSKGTLMGYDVMIGYPYKIDFRSTAKAKNILVEADSGSGKTFFMTYWLYPLFADGYNLSIMDIKGTEFAALTKALGGITLSMRSSATQFVNTFRWRKSECLDEMYSNYANSRMQLSKEMLQLFCDAQPDIETRVESLIEEFLKSMYRNIGADVNNPNSWDRTDALHPYEVYRWLEKFLSNEMRAKYGDVAQYVHERLSIYISENGSNSHMFQEEFTMEEILNTKVLTFDFGILEASSGQDKSVFKVKVFFMTLINDAFVSYKKSIGEWTAKLLEESQIVGDYLVRVYVKEIVLRRSQNQITMIAGNSVSALVDNPIAKPILDNINIMILGSLTKSSRRYLIDEYGLQDDEVDLLERLQNDAELEHTFLAVNRLEKDATTCLLRADVPRNVANSSLFRYVDTEEEE